MGSPRTNEQRKSADYRSFPIRHALTRGFTLGAPRDFRVSADGRHVTFLRSHGRIDPTNSLWLFDVLSATERLVVDCREFGSYQFELSPAEQARRERTRESASGIVAYDADRDLTVAVFAIGSQIARVDLRSGKVRVLDTVAAGFDPRLSPDTQKVAYVSGRELRVWADGEDHLLIGEETETVSWGSAEFIAAEEMGRTRGFWWSPDSDAVLIQRVDVAPIATWWISAPVTPWQAPVPIRYPVAGSANADVGLAIVGLDSSSAPSQVNVDWNLCEPPDGTARWEYLAGVDWSSDGILLTVQSRDQRTLGVIDVDRATGECHMRYQVADSHWVELVAGTPALHKGRLVTVEDRASARRLCVDGEALTGDEVQVRTVIDVSDEGIVITASTEPTSVRVATLDWSGELRWWDDSDGVCNAVVGKSTALHIRRSLTHHGATVEVRHRRCDVARIVSRAETPKLKLNLSLHRLGRRKLATALLLPNGLLGADPEAKLPVLLDPYGGPHAQRVQQVRSQFYVSQWFADQGFAVLVTDGRGTPGRGPDFEREVRNDLASVVLDDQIDALYAMAELDSRLDLDRVAIRGWSFGGYLAALAVLRRPDVFHAAIAGAPVTDWRLYDTHYSERYLGHPASEAENYERSGVLFGLTDCGAADADGARPLLLIHGLADDNVVAAHTLQLSRTLLEAGYPHSVLPLSGVTHMTPQEEVAENLMLLQLQFLCDALSL